MGHSGGIGGFDRLELPDNLLLLGDIILMLLIVSVVALQRLQWGGSDKLLLL